MNIEFEQWGDQLALRCFALADRLGYVVDAEPHPILQQVHFYFKNPHNGKTQWIECAYPEDADIDSTMREMRSIVLKSIGEPLSVRDGITIPETR